MTEHAKPVLLTGASGKLGRMLADALAAQGYRVRLTDIVPFPDPIPPGATFTRADLEDGVTILRLAEGCSTILHLGGVSTEHKFEDIIAEVAGVYPRIMQNGEMDAGAWSCGMVAGLIHDIPTCQELIERMVSEAEAIIRKRLEGMLAA